MSRWRAWLSNGLIAAGLMVWLAPGLGALRGRQAPATQPPPGVSAVILPPEPQLLPASSPARPPRPRPQPWTPTHLLIPSLKLNLVVREGSSADVLRFGPIHLPGSGAAGEADRVVIAGHRNAYGSPFKRLDRVKVGEVLFLKNSRGAWAYRILRRVIVPAARIEDELMGVSPGLTVFTCHPYWRPTHRLVLHAALVGRVEKVPQLPVWNDSAKPTRTRR